MDRHVNSRPNMRLNQVREGYVRIGTKWCLHCCHSHNFRHLELATANIYAQIIRRPNDVSQCA